VNIHVAVVDDHDLVRLAIEQLLSVTPRLTFLAGYPDVRSLCLDPRGRYADVVILDDTLPWMSVDQAVAQIGAQWPQAVLVILGGKINADDMRSLTDAGVLGFICKYDSLQDTLPTAIKWAHHGRLYLSPEALVIGRDPDLSQALTPRLRQVLELIERGLYVQDIAHELEITERAVYSARKRLKEILEARTDAELIAKAIRRGMLNRR
jgi:NarL family two-component system response regulator LiaR